MYNEHNMEQWGFEVVHASGVGQCVQAIKGDVDKKMGHSV